MTIDTDNIYGIDINDITVEDMPNDIFGEIAVTCGVRTAVLLLKNWSGTKIDVPKEGFKKIKIKIIKRKYNGSSLSIKNLARTLKLTEIEVRKIIKKLNMQTPAEGQISLFCEAEAQ